MKTKNFFLTAFAAAALITASFSLMLASDREDRTLPTRYDGRMYLMPDSSGDTTRDGPSIPPNGH